MPSQFRDEQLAARYQRFEYDFPERALAGRVIICAGGAGGLGAASTTLLVREGARVVVGYHRQRERAERLAAALAGGPGKLYLVEGDLRQAEARRRLVEAAAQLSGEVYGLVSFLGDPARVDFSALDDKALEASLATNYTSPLLLAKLVGEHMVERRVAGSLVFLATMQAVAAFEGSVNYAGAKAALVHAARILATQ